MLKRQTFKVALMLSSAEDPTLPPFNSLSVMLHFTILGSTPLVVGMRAKWWNKIGNFVKTTSSNGYGDPGLGFQETARSVK